METPYVGTLLAYPGGKYYASKIISQFVPKGTKELVSPFFGGGGLEFYMIKRGVYVYGSDKFEPLVNFWQHAIQHADKIEEIVSNYDTDNMTKEDLFDLKNSYHQLKDPIEKAAKYFILNRKSYGGLTFNRCGLNHGGRGEKRRKPCSGIVIDNLRSFKTNMLEVTLSDFTDAIEHHKKYDRFFYLDPPYPLENSYISLYGYKHELHRDFNHKLLRDSIEGCEKWIMSYNNNEKICELYKDFKIVHVNWNYGLSKKKNKYQEILILSDYVRDCIDLGSVDRGYTIQLQLGM